MSAREEGLKNYPPPIDKILIFSDLRLYCVIVFSFYLAKIRISEEITKKNLVFLFISERKRSAVPLLQSDSD